MKSETLLQVENVAVCVPDNVGRLIGKRIPISRWPQILNDGMPMPNFHLVTGIDNKPYTDLAVTGYHTGFRNGLLYPIESSLFKTSLEPLCAYAIAEACSHSKVKIPEAPRQILAHQLKRLEERGLTAVCATELEFYLYGTSYEAAHEADYHDLRPLYHLHGDNDLLISSYAENFLGCLRALMKEAGLPIFATQGEGGPGQYEINLGHSDPMVTADRHTIFKHLTKGLAHREGISASFLAKVDSALAGSSCHVHLSFGDDAGHAVIGQKNQISDLASAFLAGLLAFTPELTALHAPFENSYRRLQPGSFAPTNCTWAWDNRTCMIRLLGTQEDQRFEFRLPGADANPYHCIAAILAAGIEGIDRGLALPSATTGNAYGVGATAVPRDLTEAVSRFAESTVAKNAFTDTVHAHLLELAEHELSFSRRAVTDWQLRRGFERA